MIDVLLMGLRPPMRRSLASSQDLASERTNRWPVSDIIILDRLRRFLRSARRHNENRYLTLLTEAGAARLRRPQ